MTSDIVLHSIDLLPIVLIHLDIDGVLALCESNREINRLIRSIEPSRSIINDGWNILVPPGYVDEIKDQFPQVMYPSFTYLVKFGPQVFAQLDRAQEMTNESIRKLIIRDSETQSNSSQFFEAIYEALPHLELLALFLSRNRECGIEKCKKLRELTINVCDINSDEVISFRKSFAKMPALKKVTFMNISQPALPLTANENHGWGFVEELHLSADAVTLNSILPVVKGFKYLTIDAVYQAHEENVSNLFFKDHEILHIKCINLQTEYIIHFSDVQNVIIDYIVVNNGDDIRREFANVKLVIPKRITFTLVGGEIGISE